MKTSLSLALFYIRTKPWFFLTQAGFFGWFLFYFPHLYGASFLNPFTLYMLLNQSLVPIMFTFTIGMALFLGFGAQSDWKTGPCSLPMGEFILSRPVTRRQAYGVAAVLYLVLILATAWGAWLWAWRHPELKMGLLTPADGASQSLFPDAFKQGKTVVSPHGWLFLRGWQAWVVTLGALVAQAFFSLRLPPKVFRYALFVPVTLYIGGTFLHRGLLDGAHPVFSFFTHHVPAIAAATLLLFVAVQAFAWRRADKIEVL